MKKSVLGVTLLEMLLVLVIAGALAYAGITQYQSFRLDADVQQLKGNVNVLMQSMALYYHVNCYGKLDPRTQEVVYGTLNPDYRPTPTNPFLINIENDLRKPKYLIVVYPLSPLVDRSAPGSSQDKGYVAQFNNYQQPRKVCTAGNQATGPNDPNCQTTATIGTIYDWTMQVSVLLVNPNEATQMLALLGGDCLSDIDPATRRVRPCSQKITGNYVVWERLPSSVVPQGANATVQSFSQLYTTYPMGALIPQGTLPPSGDKQYFLCNN